MKTFKFFTSQSIVFGCGALDRLGDEILGFNSKKVFLVADPVLEKLGIVDRVKNAIEKSEIEVVLFTKVEPNPTIELGEEAAEIVRSQKDIGAVIGLGGGSSMDVAKISAMLAKNPGSVRDYIGVEKVKQFGLPTIMIPTTAGTGSEVSNASILADKQKHLKLGTMSRFLTPSLALVDPCLLTSLPPSVTASTAMDALTHAVEAYTANKAYPMTDLFALKSVELIGKYLRQAYSNGENLEARYNISLAALYAGIAIATASVGAAHALAYPVEGEYNLAHGVANGLMLPYVSEFNMLSNLGKFGEIAKAMGERTEGLSERDAALKGVEAIKQLCVDLSIPLHLREFGIKEDVLDHLSEQAFGIKRIIDNNPRKLTLADIKKIYTMAL
jgi:alcohol dehydrogenase class IV